MGNRQQQLYDETMKRRGQAAAPLQTSAPKQKRSPKNDYKATFLLHLKFAKLPEPVCEYQFHETRKWRFDFCTEASLLGWKLILITAESVNSGQAVAWIERALGIK